MIPKSDLRFLANARKQDAECLFTGSRYNGAVYLCGYALELSLKARICETLNWSDYPETNADFPGVSAFKVHNLDTLLRLTGREGAIKSTLLLQWSTCNSWNPEVRYKASFAPTEADARDMLDAFVALMAAL